MLNCLTFNLWLSYHCIIKQKQSDMRKLKLVLLVIFTFELIGCVYAYNKSQQEKENFYSMHSINIE